MIFDTVGLTILLKFFTNYGQTAAGHRMDVQGRMKVQIVRQGRGTTAARQYGNFSLLGDISHLKGEEQTSASSGLVGRLSRLPTSAIQRA